MGTSIGERPASAEQLAKENRELRARLEAAEETLRAIRADEVDALVIQQGDTQRVRTLQGGDDEAYRTFVEVMDQGAATLARDGTILYCNRHFAELLRSPLEQTIGASVYEFAALEDEGMLRACVWDGMTSSCVSKRFSVRRRDGTFVSTVLTTHPLSVEGAAW